MGVFLILFICYLLVGTLIAGRIILDVRADRRMKEYIANPMYTVSVSKMGALAILTDRYVNGYITKDFYELEKDRILNEA